MKTCFQDLIIILLLIINSLMSCDKPDLIEDPNLLASLYSKSLDTLEIEANKFILETDLSRSFTPGGPIPTKHPLIALIYLFNIDSLPIPTNIDLTKLYVIKDQLIWISTPVDYDQSNLPNYKLVKISREGPKWEPEIYVDVIAEVVNNVTSDKYLLIARHQYILKVWK